MILQVREPRAEVIDQVVATPGNRQLRYEAELTLPEARDYVLQVAEEPGGAAGEVFGASLIPVTATAAPTETAPAAGNTSGTELVIVLAFAGVVALAAITLVLAMRRARLVRRRPVAGQRPAESGRGIRPPPLRAW